MDDRGRLTHSTLPIWIALVSAAVIVYASLQPFTGWTALPENRMFFLFQLKQRWTVPDTVFNVAAYFPFGFALLAALPRQWTALSRSLLTLLLAFLLSFSMESAQQWLPTRYASIYDVLANTAGALFGLLAALLFLRYSSLLDALRYMRMHYVARGHTGDLQLVLLAMWLAAQANPAIPLFGAAYHPGADSAFEPEVMLIEFVQTTASLIGIGLFTDLTMRRRWIGGIALVVVIVLAVIIKLMAAHAFLTDVAWEVWLRPGNALGLAAGAFALMLLFWLPRGVKAVLAGIALLTGVLVMLLLPDVVTASAPVSFFNWHYGHLFSLNGLTQTCVMLWPFAATGALLWHFVFWPDEAGAVPKKQHVDDVR